MQYYWFKLFEKESNADNYLLPNTFLNFEFKGEKICVVKTTKGLFAFSNKCPHNGASLNKGFCTKQNEIVCPLHGYAFNLETGKTSANKNLILKTYPIKIEESGVYVGIISE